MSLPSLESRNYSYVLQRSPISHCGSNGTDRLMPRRSIFTCWKRSFLPQRTSNFFFPFRALDINNTKCCKYRTGIHCTYYISWRSYVDRTALKFQFTFSYKKEHAFKFKIGPTWNAYEYHRGRALSAQRSGKNDTNSPLNNKEIELKESERAIGGLIWRRGNISFLTVLTWVAFRISFSSLFRKRPINTVAAKLKKKQLTPRFEKSNSRVVKDVFSK